MLYNKCISHLKRLYRQISKKGIKWMDSLWSHLGPLFWKLSQLDPHSLIARRNPGGVYCEHFSALEKSNSWVELSWGSGSPVEFMGHIWWLGDHFSKVLALWEKIDCYNSTTLYLGQHCVMTSANSLSIGLWGTNLGEILYKICQSSFKKTHYLNQFLARYMIPYMVCTLGYNEHDEATELWAAVRLYKPDWLGPMIHSWPVHNAKNILKSITLHVVVKLLDFWLRNHVLWSHFIDLDEQYFSGFTQKRQNSIGDALYC